MSLEAKMWRSAKTKLLLDHGTGLKVEEPWYLISNAEPLWIGSGVMA